jgi:hypothetical protein
MKKVTLFLYLSFAFALVGCEGDEPFFGDLIFNEDTKYPYVSIQDSNEDLEGIASNNFWGFTLVPENDGNQVRIVYSSDDTNILYHEIYVGFDSNDSTGPLESDVLLTTLESFPTELVFTKEDIATALDVPLEDLESGNVYFRGLSEDADGNIVSDPSVFELFLGFERHAYFYRWPL